MILYHKHGRKYVDTLFDDLRVYTEDPMTVVMYTDEIVDTIKELNVVLYALRDDNTKIPLWADGLNQFIEQLQDKRKLHNTYNLSDICQYDKAIVPLSVVLDSMRLLITDDLVNSAIIPYQTSLTIIQVFLVTYYNLLQTLHTHMKAAEKVIKQVRHELVLKLHTNDYPMTTAAQFPAMMPRNLDDLLTLTKESVV